MADFESMVTAKTVSSRKRKKPDSDEFEGNIEDKRKKVEETGDNAEEPKKLINFSVPEFRAALNTVDGLKSLRDFANNVEWKITENDIVLEYLQSGGNIAEISSLLDITAQGDLATALPVFRAIYFILVRIQALDNKEYKENARHSIDNLISTFVPTFKAMINLNSTKHRKIVLKLMTAFVTFHSPYGRQILNWFTLTPVQLEQLTEPGALRRSFVMFVLSFFVGGKVSQFRPFIEKKGFLHAIIPNLKLDHEETVVLVLTILLDNVLLNPGVTKTQKINVFNTQVIQSLFQLFEWTGPKAARKGWKKPKKLSAVDEESLATVTRALQEFLRVLCACPKNGIAFHDKSLGNGPPMNPLILTAFDVLPKPWKKPETSELTIQILKRNPDLIKHCFAKWEQSFEPRDSPIWTTTVNFLIKIIDSLDTKSMLLLAFEVSSTPQIQNAFKSILLSSSVFKHLTSALRSDQSLFIRNHGLLILTAIIVKLNEFPREYEQIKKNLKQVMRSLIPSATWICEMWKLSQGSQIISDFLLNLAKLELTFLDNPRKVCKTLIKDIDGKDSRVQSAILQTISLMDPTFLAPDSEQFEEALLILLQLSWEEKPVGGAISALSRMLLNTGLWDYLPQSLDCWLGAWISVPVEKKKSTAARFVQGVKQAVAKNKPVLEEMLSLKNRDTFEEYLNNVLLHLGCVTTVPPDSGFLLDFDLITKKDFMTRFNGIDLEKDFLFWLHSGEKMDVSKVEVTPFTLDRWFEFTLQFVKSWAQHDRFNGKRQKRARDCLQLIFQFIPESSRGFGPTLISADPCALTFFNKAVSHLFGDKLLVNYFKIDTENTFTVWLKDSIDFIKVDKNTVNKEYLAEWKMNFLDQFLEIISGQHEVISENLDFWMEFLEPSVLELAPVFDQLCAQESQDQNVVERCGFVWLTSVRGIKLQTISKELGARLVGHLCRMVVLTEIPSTYCEALLTLVANQPFVVSAIRKDFIKSILRLTDVNDSLVKVGEYCVQLREHRASFLELISSGSFNGRTALALLGCVFHYPGTTGALRRAVSLPKNSCPTKIPKAVIAVAIAAKKALKKFIRGDEDVVMERHLETALIAIKALGQSDKRANSLIDGLKGSRPRFEVFQIMASFANRLQPDLLLPWLKTLIASPVEGTTWEKQANVLIMLTQDKGNQKSFVDLRQTGVWKQFVNATLRGLGLKSDLHRVAILRAVTSVSWSEGANNKELAAVFHKCSSHSEFLSIMLSNSPVKGEVVGLIFEIIRFCPDVILIGHVPVYLAAYNASLSTCDQHLLEILRKYENHCGSLSKFDPLFWGQPAVEHYSLKGTFGLSLWKQVTMKSVLALLDVEKMKASVSCFPINRKLHENIIDSNPGVYDPAFLLPLFSNLFSPGAVSYTLSFISHGALSYTIAAFASNDPEIRGAAAVVLSRFYGHLQLSQYHKQKPIWLHIIDCIRYGSKNLAATPIPGVVALFIARAVSEISDPVSSLNVLQNYLLAKPSFNLRALTEFSVLFFSDDLNCLAHRKWILEIIRDGIRTQSDVTVIVRRPVLKIILTAFPGILNELKMIVLEIVERIFRARGQTKIVIDEFGLISWIRNISPFINGALMKTYLSVLQACADYLLAMEEEKGMMRKMLSNLARLESAVVQACRKTDNLQEVVTNLRAKVS